MHPTNTVIFFPHTHKLHKLSKESTWVGHRELSQGAKVPPLTEVPVVPICHTVASVVTATVRFRPAPTCLTERAANSPPTLHSKWQSCGAGLELRTWEQSSRELVSWLGAAKVMAQHNARPPMPASHAAAVVCMQHQEPYRDRTQTELPDCHDMAQHVSLVIFFADAPCCANADLQDPEASNYVRDSRWQEH